MTVLGSSQCNIYADMLGYIIKWRTPSIKIKKETFEFFRMFKVLEQDSKVI